MWKILVVDDDYASRLLLIELLRDVAVCDAAANGREGVEAYNIAVEKDEPYDLILLDIAMPEVDGMSFLGMVRENEEKSGVRLGEGVPVIMVTAFPNFSFKAFNRGCDDYILKPVDGKKLVEKVKEKLEGK